MKGFLKFFSLVVLLVPAWIAFLTITGEYPEFEGFASYDTDADLALRPDLSTTRAVPWASDRSVQVIHDVCDRDGTLVEFSSVVDAVNCAIAIQSALAEADGAIRLRIGINLGDVIVDDDDIYGDGVNIAARLEALAEPGESAFRTWFTKASAPRPMSPSRTSANKA